MITTTAPGLLTDEMLDRFDERCPRNDRDNTFFTEDFEELRRSGFLSIAVPPQYGGSGASLEEVSRALREIAYVAPATALAVNMHLYWTGVASDLLSTGDESCNFILEQAGAGRVFAAIHGEPGNDMPLLLSTTDAARVEGGWRLNGHKIFGSLSPVWDYGGFHAMDTSEPASPMIVHGFADKDAPGLEIVDTWDTLGMRATQSQDTVLHDVFVPDRQVVRVCPAGMAGADMFQVAIFAWALMGFASVYLGAARRAYDITIETMPKRSSIALTRSMASHPEVQHNVAEMRMALDASEALLERTCADWAAGVAHGDWPVRLVGARHRVINDAFDIADRALDLSGGAAVFKRNRLEQLYRDIRMGRFHPGNTLLAHELIGKLCLGIDPDEAPRWG